MTDIELLDRMMHEIRQEEIVRLKNSEIIRALQSPRLELRNCALILARRRGIQVVDVSDRTTS